MRHNPRCAIFREPPTLQDPNDFEALEALWNLPSPGDTAHHDYTDERARRNAMYEYCYAKRDHLEQHLAEGERMLKAVLAGETIKVPCTIGMSKYYRSEIHKYILEHTVEPILIAISPDQRYLTLKKHPQPLPIEDLAK